MTLILSKLKKMLHKQKKENYDLSFINVEELDNLSDTNYCYSPFGLSYLYIYYWSMAPFRTYDNIMNYFRICWISNQQINPLIVTINKYAEYKKNMPKMINECEYCENSEIIQEFIDSNFGEAIQMPLSLHNKFVATNIPLYEDNWVHQFTNGDTISGFFKKKDNKLRSIVYTFLTGIFTLNHYCDDKISMVELPLISGAIMLFIIIRDNSVDNSIDNLSKLFDIRKTMENMYIQIPKFSVGCSYDFTKKINQQFGYSEGKYTQNISFAIDEIGINHHNQSTINSNNTNNKNKPNKFDRFFIANEMFNYYVIKNNFILFSGIHNG